MFEKKEVGQTNAENGTRSQPGNRNRTSHVVSKRDSAGSDLEEGELYAVRKGKLEKLPRNDDGGMRKVRITEKAYEVAMEIANELKAELIGYRPDIALVVSGLIVNGNREKRNAKDAVKSYATEMFRGEMR